MEVVVGVGGDYHFYFVMQCMEEGRGGVGRQGSPLQCPLNAARAL